MQKRRKSHKLSVRQLGEVKKLPVRSDNNGTYIIIADSYGYLKWKHFELLRRGVSKGLKQLGKKQFKLVVPMQIWRGFSKKPLQSRMGKGSGSVFVWKVFVVPGAILFRVSSYKLSKILNNIFRKISSKLPIKIKYNTK